MEGRLGMLYLIERLGTRIVFNSKTSDFLEQKTALVSLVDARPKGHVERPQSELASDHLQFRQPRLVPSAYCMGAWDKSRDCSPVFAVSETSKTGQHIL